MKGVGNMAYTKFTKKWLEDIKTQTYNKVIQTTGDKQLAEKMAQLQYEIHETFRVADLEHKANKRKGVD